MTSMWRIEKWVLVVKLLFKFAVFLNSSSIPGEPQEAQRNHPMSRLEAIECADCCPALPSQAHRALAKHRAAGLRRRTRRETCFAVSAAASILAHQEANSPERIAPGCLSHAEAIISRPPARSGVEWLPGPAAPSSPG
jgi:hypothetical protein